MGKELIISANRHETKVAILEDDQLVEIFFQRANEYSLAGSIHKGRVTRVLPGMQSAFVDIGLERDAFLYVSDFFEDNEEYDRIAGAAEEKVVRSERAVPAGVVEPAAVAPPAEPPAAAPVPPRVFERQEEDEGLGRRGRRSRRRRARGRGFPESKYAAEIAPAPHTAGEPPEPVPPPAPVEVAAAEEFPVLPGESLAKYTPVAGQAVSPAPDSAPEPEPEADAVVVQAVAPASEFAPEPGLLEEEGEDQIAELPDQLIPEGAEPEPEPVQAESAAAEAEPAPAGAEEVEPARMPVSLTATLREQGYRYPHRISRRMRRKMRGDGLAETEAAEAREAPRGNAEATPEDNPDASARQERERPPQPSISELLREGQEILVQIAKEPLGQKGARITSHIALPGRYVVYMPTVEHLGVSRKIVSDEERLRLKRILQAHRAGVPGGYIVRTAGEGKSEEEIAADMGFLFNHWLDVRQKAEARKAPALIHHDLDLVSRILRDQMTEQFKSVWTDNEEVYESVLRFVERFQPNAVHRVKMYTRDAPIFDAFNVTAEMEKALRPKVWLKSGGYIVINQTEALVAIDVNTGKFVGKSNRLEDTIVKTNTEAVKEIVRQVRLRDLGGIIVVDFIDMDERKNRQKVMQALEEAMRSDRAPNKILQFNDFGLVAITRKRVKQSLERTLCSPCPYCEGAGYVKSVQTVIGEILQEAHKIARAVEGSDVTLRVHPDVAKLLKSSDNDYLEEIEEVLGRPVLVISDASLQQEKFDLV
ncbi:MAG: Rne/Rng family ribonuclease [Bryobacteraceae bacterium]|jgi:ribonuclease G